MFGNNCTIYNHYTDPATRLVKYQRTVLGGIFWDSARGANIRKNGADNADSVTLIIPKNVRVTGQYMKPRAWGRLANKAGYWTIQPEDYVALGIVPDIPLITMAELDQQYDDVRKVTTVDEKSFGGSMAHWEVGGK